MIQINNVTKKYDTVYALDSVSLDIKKNRTVLLGPSGSGKTTLLRMIAQLDTPTFGSIYSNGKISVVFQKDYLFDHLSVYDNIGYGLNHKDYSKEDIKKKVEATAKICHIDFSLQQKTSTLSGGQRQRVSLARAIVEKPDILLMDEPFSQLDHALKMKLIDEVIEIVETYTIQLIYVTHDTREAEKIGGEFIYLKKGKVEKISNKIIKKSI